MSSSTGTPNTRGIQCDYRSLHNGISTSKVPVCSIVHPRSDDATLVAVDTQQLGPVAKKAKPSNQNSNNIGSQSTATLDIASFVESSSSSSRDYEMSGESSCDTTSESPETPLSIKSVGKTKVSFVHEHFLKSTLSEYTKSDGTIATDYSLTCKHCKGAKPACYLASILKSSTTNLQKHLSTHGITSVGSQTSSNLPGWVTTAKAPISFPEQLREWIVATDQPFTAIEQPSFRALLEHFPSSALLKTRTADGVKKAIERDLEKCQTALQETFENLDSGVAVSLDAWTSPNQIAFLAVIAHYITESFDYQETLLDFKEIQGSHTAENLSETVISILRSYGLESKLFTITGDNASNNEAMLGLVCSFFIDLNGSFTFEKISNALPSSNTYFDEEFSFIRCLAHVTNLVVKDILKSLKAGNYAESELLCDTLTERNRNAAEQQEDSSRSAISKIRAFAIWVTRSPQRKSEYQRFCANLNVSAQIIPYDVETRWNSCYRMIKTALDSRGQLERFFKSRHDLEPLKLSTKEWLHLIEIKRVLAFFDNTTQMVSTSEALIWQAIPIYYIMSDYMNDIIERKEEWQNVSPEMVAATKVGKKKFDKYYEKMDRNIVYFVGTLLNPCYKATFLRAHLDHYAYESTIEDVRTMFNQRYNISGADNLMAASPEPPNSQSVDDIYARIQKDLPGNDVTVSDELESYLMSDRVVPPKDCTHGKAAARWVLKWWHEHSNQYPNMSKMAKDYLAVPGTSVSVERLFSGGRDTLGIRRMSLGKDTMRTLTLLKNRYKMQ